MSTRKDNSNKAALAVYICLYIEEQAPAQLQEDESIVLAGGYEDGEKVMVVGKQVLANENLFCSHEEADTRMILHAIELSPNYSRIVVRSDDTDVLVLLLYYCSIGNCMAMYSCREVIVEGTHNCSSLSAKLINILVDQFACVYQLLMP